MATPASILDYVAPNLSTIDAGRKDFFLAQAANEIRRDVFSNGDTYNRAVAYLAAHYLELSTRGGDSRGPLTSEKEGDLARSYANSSSANTDANSTQYLVEYQRLIKARVSSVFSRTGQIEDVI